MFVESPIHEFAAFGLDTLALIALGDGSLETRIAVQRYAYCISMLNTIY